MMTLLDQIKTAICIWLGILILAIICLVLIGLSIVYPIFGLIMLIAGTLFVIWIKEKRAEVRAMRQIQLIRSGKRSVPYPTFGRDGDDKE